MFDPAKIKVMAFDLDGTLSQHKTPFPQANKDALSALNEKYKLIMLGAGKMDRIFNQIDRFPIDVIGNYGLQYAKYNHETKSLDVIFSKTFPIDVERTEKIVTELRKKYSFENFSGSNVEYHPSGCITIPLLGTQVELGDKLKFDPKKAKRRAIYKEICALFPDYNVFVAGTSSFDLAPKPYTKYYALNKWCEENGYSHDEVVFVGDDYGEGGNDESIFLSDFNFLKIDNYLDFPKVVKELL